MFREDALSGCHDHRSVTLFLKGVSLQTRAVLERPVTRCLSEEIH